MSLPPRQVTCCTKFAVCSLLQKTYSVLESTYIYVHMHLYTVILIILVNCSTNIGTLMAPILNKTVNHKLTNKWIYTQMMT